MTRLSRGDLLPKIVTPPPGRRARQLSRSLARAEAPGVNTLQAGAPTILWQEAKGANVLDVDGNRFLDLTSGFGVAAVGHRHPRVVAAVR
ncbi:MAG: aminotransferase class III-fold pyridoxal phosphate-dependent enzyme, partial [Thermoanaerobaculia bacterium]